MAATYSPGPAWKDGEREQRRAGGDRQHDADRMNDAVGDDLGARIVEAAPEGDVDMGVAIAAMHDNPA